MNNCAFTICAKNYLGLAKVLEQSIKKYTGNIDFYIIIADEFDEDEIKKLEKNILIAKKCLAFDNNKWIELSFKYDLTEFCTCIKPFCFQYLFEAFNYEKICYFDPDVYFFDSADIIYDKLINCQILLTPHKLILPKGEDKMENEILYAGLFNLGFIGIRKGADSFRFINWWAGRLLNGCFADPNKFFFTDQKWMNFLPIYFNSDILNISRDLGWNIAPWNFNERKILFIGQRLYAVPRDDDEIEDQTIKYPLLFMHFSGYDYISMINGSIQQKSLNHDIFFDDLNIAFDIYKKNLLTAKNEILLYYNRKYSYNYYDNGAKIDIFHRKLYNGLLLGKINVGNPFNHSNKQFFGKLKSCKMLGNFDPGKAIARHIGNIGGKLKIVNLFMRLFYKIIGYRNYIMFLRFCKFFSQYENQIHLINTPPVN